MALPFEKPFFPGKNEYFFTTSLGTRYQVLFGRKTQDIFNYVIVFGVQNEEFEENEYCETNRFEIHAVMTTILAILVDFIQANPNIKVIEFMGQPKVNPKKINQRNLLFIRYLKRSPWSIDYDPVQQRVRIVVR